MHTKFVVTSADGNKLGTSICERAGIEAELVRRIVIDLGFGRPGKIYLELFATEEMLDVDISEVGIEVRAEDPEAEPASVKPGSWEQL